ncbi:MAG: SOS response-associated peptidase [Anaerolineaceae bacterium]|nr:SOS response-associated peptidase [Anaerolineaceae bacterium]
MCGRFTLTADLDTIQQAFNLTTVPAVLSPRYNIAPSQPIAIVTNEAPTTLSFHSWGLLPSWAKDPALANKLINARSETAHEKPSFRSAFKRRRCLIPADGFFEWQKQGSDKVPMFIHLKDSPVFALAGLWEVWNNSQGDEIRTCTILTTEANDFMQSIHTRMPVILAPADYDLWLSSAEEPVMALQSLMRPYDSGKMAAYAVSKLVNRPLNDTPRVIEPVH